MKRAGKMPVLPYNTHLLMTKLTGKMPVPLPSFFSAGARGERDFADCRHQFVFFAVLNGSQVEKEGIALDSAHYRRLSEP